jgi:predicted nucleic acid-binding protein
MNFMTGPLFLDTNILIYSLDPSEPAKRAKAVALIRAGLRGGNIVTSPQTLNECYRVLTMKRALVSQADARSYLRGLLFTCVAPMNAATSEAAWQIQDETGFHWWDCVMLASALAARAMVFITEDLTDGVTIGGMRIVDPFVNDISAFLST